MSELQNPLFEEEKEFLERKKLEYERALRGDVVQLKENTAQVGRVALAGAGLAGSIWLITKVLSRKKRKSRASHSSSDQSEYNSEFDSADDRDHFYDDDPAASHKSAAASAEAFMDYHEQGHEGDDLGFGATAGPPASDYDYDDASASGHDDAADDRAPAQDDDDDDTAEFEDDPFQDLPYDDSRRLPASHAYDDAETPSQRRSNSRSRMVGTVLQSFLQSDTGKILVAQVAAVALALVTKKVGELFPTDKNPDLAASPGKAPAEPGTYPVGSSASFVSSDASNTSQSL